MSNEITEPDAKQNDTEEQKPIVLPFEGLPESNGSTGDIIKNLQNLVALIVAFGAILTATGFVIVNSFLSNYTDLHGYNVHSSSYLAGGIGQLITFILATLSIMLLQFALNFFVKIIGSLNSEPSTSESSSFPQPKTNVENRNNVLLQEHREISLYAQSFSKAAERILGFTEPSSKIASIMAILLTILSLVAETTSNDSAAIQTDFLNSALEVTIVTVIFIMIVIIGVAILWSLPLGRYLNEIISDPLSINGVVGFFILIIIFSITGLGYAQFIYGNIDRSIGGGRPSTTSVVFSGDENILGQLEPVLALSGHEDLDVCVLAELTDGYLFYAPSLAQTISIKNDAILALVDSGNDLDCSPPDRNNSTSIPTAAPTPNATPTQP